MFCFFVPSAGAVAEKEVSRGNCVGRLVVDTVGLHCAVLERRS